MAARARATALGPVENGAATFIEMTEPVTVVFKVEGISPVLFHRWCVEGVAAKAAAAKGSAAKKTDDVESYVWRDSRRRICIPGEYFRQSMIHAARFRQDPRSPRKSAIDLYRAGLVSLTELAPIMSVSGAVAKTWDYLDQRRVQVVRASVTRSRPAFLAGWSAELHFQIQTPEYISIADFRDVLMQAGRLIGVGDFRPSYGRFQIVSCKMGT